MKIDAPRINMGMGPNGEYYVEIGRMTGYANNGRFVRESDWRKIMAVVREANEYPDTSGLADALIALRKHLAKK